MSEHKVHTKLGSFFATAICGNDILSSALYVSGIAAIFAGVYAPLVLAGIGVVLFFYRAVYREVVEALPVNGGAYNGLLNGTSKTVAAVAGVMTILSYIATAVISAKTAVEYLFTFLEKVFELFHLEAMAHSLPDLVIPSIIVVLFLFAMLVISGVKDSAKVAAGIFSFHVFTLISFIVIGGFLVFSGRSMFSQNLALTHELVQSKGGLAPTLFFAFSACLLGVSGFESSANFVEEQKKGVFKKTLTNMLVGVAVFNPLIALVVLNMMPLHEIGLAKDFLLAEAAYTMGGIALLGWIAINAFLVLCGAVLTSYVGVSGLVNRMSLDDCLPSFLIKENAKGSHPRIILTFFALSTSILLMTRGDLLSLAGVYTISFLGVMTLFALGNLILRRSRPDLKRPYRAPFLFVVIAFFSTAIGVVGNSLIDPRNDIFFLMYFIPALTLVLVNIFKKDILKALLPYVEFFTPLYRLFQSKYDKSANSDFHVFIHHSANLYPTLNYINKNENGRNITLIHCKNGDEGQREEIQTLIPELAKAGAFPYMNINYKIIDKEFGPNVVQKYALDNHVSPNRIFIGSIHDSHKFDYEDFGGVRIIS